MSSSERFGFEWHKYSFLDPNYEFQFKNWIFPFKPEDFRGKKILDAGCGMGRNSYWVLKWGAGEVIAFDCDQRSLEAARNNLKQFNNAQVLFQNLYDINWQDEFDVVFSIGVIHHLEQPKLAIKKLLNALKPDGILIIWVYSFEGNEWIIRFISPIRKKITSKLSLPLVHLLSYFFSIPLWLFVKIFKGPSQYLKQLSEFKFWHVHSIVFDQLIPEVANYWTKEQALGLFSGFNYQEIKISHPPNNMGWTILIKK